MSLFRKLGFCSKPSRRQRSSTQCAVCLDAPQIPCTVPCGNSHVFCLSCLEGLVTHNSGGRSFPCPLCRKRVRIPLGGVAAFRNDRSLRSKVLSHIPAIRPRWRRRPSYSFSDISDYDLDSLPLPVPSEQGFGNGDDDDVLSDISDTLTEGSEQGDGPDLSDVYILLESQQAILDQILRERERASGPPWVEEVLQDFGDPATRGTGEEAPGVAREVELPPGGRAGEHWPVPGGLTSEEEELQAAVTLALRMDRPDSPPLDIAVMLGLISDLEEHDRLEDVAGQATSETTEEKQAAQPPTETTAAAATTTAAAEEEEEEEGREAAAAQALSAQRPACRRRENTRSYTTNEDPASQAEERPDDQPEDEDWKHKATACPGIPRPKLVTLANPDERRTRTQQGEEEEGALGGICPGVLQPQTATVGLASCQEDLAPAAERWRRLEVQPLGMQATQEEACRGQQPDWTLPQVPGECKDQGHQRPEAFDPKQKTSPAVKEGKLPTTFLRPELESEDWGTHDVHPNLAPEAERSVPERGRKWLSAYRHEETSKGLLPEEWRLEELRRMEVARARTQSVLGEEDLGLDADVIISEDPTAWARRIRELQRRKRSKAESKRLAVDTQVVEQAHVIPTDCEGKGVGVGVGKETGSARERGEEPDRKDKRHITIVTV